MAELHGKRDADTAVGSLVASRTIHNRPCILLALGAGPDGTERIWGTSARGTPDTELTSAGAALTAAPSLVMLPGR